MKYNEISGLASEELVKKVNEMSKELFEKRMKNGLGQVQNPLVIRSLRRDIAKLKTALRQKLS
jgi:large subunit ribosomal protein L29